MGSLHKRRYPPQGKTYKAAQADGTLLETAVWWIKYYANGRAIRESTGTTKENVAKRELRKREGRVAAGEPVLPRVDRIRYEEVAQDLRQHYEATGKRDLREYSYRVKHLDRFFAGRRVAAIGQAEVDAYTVHRQGQGAAGATIRRELGTLVKMLRLAYKTGKLLRLPVFDKPEEGPPRQGFFERAPYEAVRRRLPPDLQVAVAIAYTYGWRMQSEVLVLERRQLDLEAGTLRLDAGSTKNDEGRLVYLTPELRTLLAAQIERIRAVERKTGRIIPFLFPYLSGRRRLGQRRRDFRKSWATACRAAGVPGMLRHDFRRTAVRDMVNDGTPEKVNMMITGHKTRSVFDRYHIVAPGDLKAATARIAARDGHSLGHRAVGTVDTRRANSENPSTGG